MIDSLSFRADSYWATTLELPVGDASQKRLAFA